MRIISTLFLLVISSSCFAQAVDTSNVVIATNCWGNRRATECKSTAPPKDTIQRTGIKMQCGGTITSNLPPLIIINGVPIPFNKLERIDPNNIERIEIVKGPEATVIYGSEGANGVILITTKLTYKKISIKDALDQTPVAAATMSFNFQGRENSLNYIADDQGVILSNSWKELAQSAMNISAVGYKTFYRETPGDDSVIYLKRDIKICQEVVIATSGLTRCRCWGCRGNTRCINTLKKESIDAKPTGSMTLNFYPNPVQRGASINIQFNDPNSISAIRVLSLDGRNLLQQPVARVQKSIFRLETDPRWAAGIYFVQLLYENGRVAASEKIILQ